MSIDVLLSFALVALLSCWCNASVVEFHAAASSVVQNMTIPGSTVRASGMSLTNANILFLLMDDPELVIAADIDSGKIIWRRAVSYSVPKMLITPKLIVISAFNAIQALDVSTGALVWNSSLPEYEKYISRGAAKISATQNEPVIYVYSPDGVLTCHKETTGQLIWTAQVYPNGKYGGYPSSYSDASLVHDGVVVLSANLAWYYDGTGILLAHGELNDLNFGVTITSDFLLVADDIVNGNYTAYDPKKNFEKTWSVSYRPGDQQGVVGTFAVQSKYPDLGVISTCYEPDFCNVTVFNLHTLATVWNKTVLDFYNPIDGWLRESYNFGDDGNIYWSNVPGRNNAQFIGVNAATGQILGTAEGDQFSQLVAVDQDGKLVIASNTFDKTQTVLKFATLSQQSN